MSTEIITGIFTIAGVIIGGIIQQIIAFVSNMRLRKNDIRQKKDETSVKIVEFVTLTFGACVHKNYCEMFGDSDIDIVCLQTQVEIYSSKAIKEQFNRYLDLWFKAIYGGRNETFRFLDEQQIIEIEKERDALVDLIKKDMGINW